MAFVGVITARKGISIPGLIVVTATVFCVYFFNIIILESFYSRTILLILLPLSALTIVLSFILSPKSRIIAASVLAIFTATLQYLDKKPTEYITEALDLGTKPSISRSFINTAMYVVESLRFQHYFDDCSNGVSKCQPPLTGGGISTFGDGYLLATGGGKLHSFNFDQKTKKITTKQLPYQIPINEGTYLDRVGENIAHTFRVTDILVREEGDRFELFAAHHYWYKKEDCGTMKISHASGNTAAFSSGKESITWDTIFETTPCLKLFSNQLTRGGESGGRMGFYDDHTLMLTVGDYQHDGIDQQPMMAQDQHSSYGKSLLIDLNSGTASIFTRGHRNPQGLYIDHNGVIWSTEHGPEGGDEVNILEKGANYGWPLVTYGTQYGEHVWPWNPRQGRHDGFKQPLYTWLPSAAISNLIRLEKGAFPLWADDFLAGNFKKSLYHFRVQDGRVVFVEKLHISGSSGRIRDLLEDQHSRVVLYLDDGSIIFLFPRDDSDKSAVSEKMRGSFIFAKCSACHKIGDGNTHGIGPDLLGIIDKDVASNASYGYSQALKSLAGNWDKDRLDKFLANPMKHVPGTSMAFEGLHDEADRAAVIRYLESWQ